MGDGTFDPADMELDLVDEVEPLIKAAINNHLAETVYQGQAHCEKLSDNINDEILKKLVQEVKKPFKYVITTTLMQKNGAGMFATASKHWDRAADGGVQVSWQNQTIHALVCVYAIATFPTQDPLGME